MRSLKNTWKVLSAAGLLFAIASPAYARGIQLKDAGAAVWIFLAIGALIVLLQLIPATLLFFSFIGSGSAMVFGRKKAAQEEGDAEKEVIAVKDYSAATVKK